MTTFLFDVERQNLKVSRSRGPIERAECLVKMLEILADASNDGPHRPVARNRIKRTFSDIEHELQSVDAEFSLEVSEETLVLCAGVAEAEAEGAEVPAALSKVVESVVPKLGLLLDQCRLNRKS